VALQCEWGYRSLCDFFGRCLASLEPYIEFISHRVQHSLKQNTIHKKTYETYTCTRVPGYACTNTHYKYKMVLNIKQEKLH